MDASSVLMNFMLSDDGNTLLSVRQGSDGSLELMTTPVTIIQDSTNNLSQLLKTQNSNILNQIKLHNELTSINEETLSNPIEVIDLESQNFQAANEKQFQPTEVLNNTLPCTSTNIQGATKVISLEKEQTSKKLHIEKTSPSVSNTSINHGKSSPSSKKHARKTLGRPKKSSKTEDKEQTWFTCEICGQQFQKQYLMQKHMHEHAQDKPHHCPKCPASFNVPTNFTLHMATHNIGEPKCPECGRKFARMASLKSHMVMHEVDENLYCTECDDAFGTKAQLEAHLKLHNEKCSSDDYRRCKLCRKQFTQPVLYRQHLRDHYKLQTKCIKQTKRGIRHRTVYKCRICLKVFEKPSQLVRHIRVHTGEKPYKCHLCNRSFTQKGSVRIHMWQHSGIRPYSCSFCNAKFSQKGNLNGHILRVHKIQEGMPMYRCTQCPCIFKKLGSLNGHLKRAHSGEPRDADEEEQSDEEVQTSVADDAFEEQSEIVDGPVSNVDESPDELPKNFEDGFVVTDDNETAVVTLLDKTTDDPKGKYIKIKQRSVNNFRFYECSFCDKKFKKPSDLMRHLRIHTQEKPFKCKICSKSFTLKSTMLSHEKIHKNVENFSCQECSSFFNSEKALQAHEKFHNKEHRCAICNMNFSTFDELKSHAKAKHMVSKKERLKTQISPEVQNLAPKIVLKEPLVLTEASNGLLHAQPKFRNEIAHGKGRPHKCPACPAAFMKLSHLKQHHRKHTGERPYVCFVCDRRFTTNGALKTHQRIHDLSQPYKCYICSRSFSVLSSMKRHLITHSNKRPIMCPYCNKTFKTTDNCRKHMQKHKHEIAQQQLELQKKQQNSPNSTSTFSENVTIIEQIPVTNEKINYQTAATLPQNLNSSLQRIIKNGDKSVFSVTPVTQNIQMGSQNIPVVDNPNIGTTQTLHADETGTVTLSNYTGDQTLTPESIREIEETLNQQLSSIGMNLALNSTVRQIEEHNNISLEAQDQPVLSIIYDSGKTLSSPMSTSMNPNIFTPQFDSFDINQITLQGENGIDMGITEATSTNMASILPKSNQENQCYSPHLINNDFEMSMINNQNQFANKIVSNSAIEEKENDMKQDNNKMDTENSFQCHICQMQGFSAEDLKEHLKTHDGIRKFECTHCSSTFCSTGGLNRHIKIHEVQETYKCYECNKEFPTSLKLREHIKDTVKNELKSKKSEGGEDIIDDIELKNNDGTTKRRKNKCLYCPKIFRKPSDLIRHIRTHTGERPYQCQFCEKSFAVKCTLDAHLKVHGGEKPFHCHVCNAMLATKGSLKVHMRLHTGAKPFKCSVCDMKFRTSGHRKIHMVSHTRDPSASCSRKPKKQAALNTATDIFNNLEPIKVDQIPHILPMPQETNILPDSQTIDDDHHLSTITINSVNDQITFNADDGAGLLSLSENSQLVANFQFLLANGLVTIQTEDPTISTELPLSSVTDVQNDFVTASIVPKIEDQGPSPQVIYTSEIPNSLSTLNENDFQMNNCMVLQLENVDSTVPDKIEENMKQTKSPSNATRRECDICGKAFAKPCQVERHKRIHTGERPFKCELCNKAFAQKSTLQMHQKHHAGDRPHSCPHCTRSFTQNGNLQTHLKRVHKIDTTQIKKTTKTQQQFVHYDLKLAQQSPDDSRMLSFDDLSIVELLK